MKTKRRALALVLAIVMVFSLSIAAFARDGGTITSATINGETATVTTIDGVNSSFLQVTFSIYLSLLYHKSFFVQLFFIKNIFL